MAARGDRGDNSQPFEATPGGSFKQVTGDGADPHLAKLGNEMHIPWG